MSVIDLKRLVLERHRPILHAERWSVDEGWTGPQVCEECSPEVPSEPELWLPEPWPCDYIKALEKATTR